MLTMGKGAVVSCLSKYIHLSLCVPNHHVNNEKGHLLDRTGVLYRELKNIRSKVVIAITVTPPGIVDDGDMTELNPLESHFYIISDVDPHTFSYDEGNYVLEETIEGDPFSGSQTCHVHWCSSLL